MGKRNSRKCFCFFFPDRKGGIFQSTLQALEENMQMDWKPVNRNSRLQWPTE